MEGKMKILLVTSEVTFVPENYNLFLENFFSELSSEKDIQIELAVLKNNSHRLTLQGLAMMAMGAKNIGFHLLRNCIRARFNDRLPITNKFAIRLTTFDGPNTQEFLDFIKNENIDLVINARTRFIYKQKVLKAPKLGCMNIHHGILPDFRGTMCDLWALYENRPTGFTIHMMEKKIDTGKIIRVKETTSRIKEVVDHYAEILRASSIIEGKELASLVKEINFSKQIPIALDNQSTKATYTKIPIFLQSGRCCKKV